MLIPPKKRGVAENLLYPSVGPAYANIVVVINGYWYYIGINMAIITLRTGSVLMTFVALGHSAPMICVAHWNIATPSSRLFTLSDW